MMGTNAVKGIQHYSSEDNDVATFGCILRNEVEEEFRPETSQKLHRRPSPPQTDFPYIQDNRLRSYD